MITVAPAGQPAISALRVTFMRRPRILTWFCFSDLSWEAVCWAMRSVHATHRKLMQWEGLRVLMSKQIHYSELKGHSRCLSIWIRSTCHSQQQSNRKSFILNESERSDVTWATETTGDTITLSNICSMQRAISHVNCCLIQLNTAADFTISQLAVNFSTNASQISKFSGTMVSIALQKTKVLLNTLLEVKY